MLNFTCLMDFPSFSQVLDFIGTFAFAISGIRLASAKRFDLFGAYVVGFTTAGGRRYGARLNARAYAVLDADAHVCGVYGFRRALGGRVRQGAHTPEQHVVSFRHHRVGCVHRYGRGENPGAGLSLVDGNHNGYD